MKVSAHDRLGAEIVKVQRRECADCDHDARVMDEMILKPRGWSFGAPEAHWLLARHDEVHRRVPDAK
jgi:hypothetical protein